MAERPERVTNPWLAVAVSATMAVVLAACGGGQNGNGPSGSHGNASGQSGGGQQPVENASLTVRPMLLPVDVVPKKLFSCTKNGKGEEVVRGPNLKTNLREVRVARSSHGICAVFAFPKGTPRYPNVSQAIQLTFYRHGDTSAPLESRTSGQLRRNVQISVYSDPILKDGRYELGTSVPKYGGNGSTVTAGRLGAAGQVVSVLVTQPRMPAWVLDRDTVWRAKFT